MSDDQLSITVTDDDGQTQTVEAFMSYGMLNDLVKVIGHPNKASALDLDPDLALMVLAIVLVPRSKSGKPQVKLTEFDPPGMSVEEAMKVFDWVKDHTLNFFAKRLEASLQSIKDRKADFKQIGSIVDGLQD